MISEKIGSITAEFFQFYETIKGWIKYTSGQA